MAYAPTTLGAEASASGSATGGMVTKYSTKIGYMGLNKANDAITSSILSSGGSSTFQSYAATAGSAGGAAICAPYGPLAAGICGNVGGTVARILAGGLFKSPESEWQTPSSWNTYTKEIRIAQEGIAAVRGYLTQRDFFLDIVADLWSPQARDVSRAWANDWLTQHGVPAAPIDPRWAPRSDLWNTYKEVVDWSFKPGVWPPYVKQTGKYAAGQPTSQYYTASNGVGGWCQLATQLKQSCSSVILSTLYRGGPPAAPGSAIDWGMVGAFQIVAVPQMSGQYAVAIPNKFTLRGSTMIAHKNVLSSNQLYKDSLIEANVIPAQVGMRYSLELQEKGPQLVAAAKALSTNKLKLAAVAAATIARLQQQERSEQTTMLAVAAGVIGVGALGYWWHRRSKR